MSTTASASPSQRSPARRSPARRGLARPEWRLEWEGVDVTRDLAGMALSIAYADHLSGHSDTLEVALEDADGRWAGPWYPTKGDGLSLAIGYAGEPHLPCGDFVVDEMDLAGPPDTLTVRCLAAGIAGALRTRRDRAFEATDLAAVAHAVAADHGLEAIGIDAGLAMERVSQTDETDLAFLTRLAEEWGFVFSVRGDRLVFQPLEEVEGQPASVALDRADLSDWRLVDTTRLTYRACEVSYFDPHAGDTFTALVEADGAETAGDTLRRTIRSETAEQAEARARALLHRANARRATGTLTLPGEPRLMAGLVIDLAGLGRLDGRWLIEASHHRLDRAGGYATEIECRHV